MLIDVGLFSVEVSFNVVFNALVLACNHNVKIVWGAVKTTHADGKGHGTLQMRDVDAMRMAG